MHYAVSSKRELGSPTEGENLNFGEELTSQRFRERGAVTTKRSLLKFAFTASIQELGDAPNRRALTLFFS